MEKAHHTVLATTWHSDEEVAEAEEATFLVGRDADGNITVLLVTEKARLGLIFPDTGCAAGLAGALYNQINRQAEQRA